MYTIYSSTGTERMRVTPDGKLLFGDGYDFKYSPHKLGYQISIYSKDMRDWLEEHYGEKFIETFISEEIMLMALLKFKGISL